MSEEHQPPPEPDDDDLMHRTARNDDAQAFGILVRRHQGLLLRYATRMLGGDSDAGADVAQEAFVRLWLRRNVYEPRGSLRSYLLHVAHNLCLDDRRAAKYIAPWDACPEDAPATHGRPGEGLMAHVIRDAVQSLPPRERAVFVLTEYEALSYKEVADALGVSTGRVGSAKHEAVLRLRHSLSALLREEGFGK